MEAETDRTRTAAGIEGAQSSRRVRRLSVVRGDERGVRHLLDATPVELGRSGHVEGPFGLRDTEVSRHHATVSWDDGAQTHVVEDHGSRNGSFCNGARVARSALGDGDVLRIGTTLLLYEDVELPAHADLEPETSGLPGPSLPMQRVRADVKLVAPQSIPVLLLGESGVGKELVAAEIHRQSRRQGELVAVNAAAIAREVAESEIFGHVSGAFTGAQRRNEGLFVAAAGGTLLLDEIGEMALDLQAKLLRALATGEVRPVGSSQALHVDVRVVAATNRDLAAAVAAGTFRGDLLARLQGWTLRIAPLRERREDVLALARRFAALDAGDDLGADLAEALLLHDWPFNVRELEQTIAVARVRAGAGPLLLDHLPPSFAARLRDRAFSRGAAPVTEPPLELVVARDRPPTADELARVLARFDGNVADVAEYFGKDRKQIYRWVERAGIDPESFRKG